jgi:FtsZ-interacting cell division protein ZipA
MSGTTIIILIVIVALAFWGWNSRRLRLKEEHEMDMAYRREVLKRNKTKPMTEDEEDYLLKLRTGKGPNRNRGEDNPQ